MAGKAFRNRVNNLYNHLGDIAAIPFFFLLTIYFIHMENKSFFEWILLVFSAIGFVADVIFTYFFIVIK